MLWGWLPEQETPFTWAPVYTGESGFQANTVEVLFPSGYHVVYVSKSKCHDVWKYMFISLLLIELVQTFRERLVKIIMFYSIECVSYVNKHIHAHVCVNACIFICIYVYKFMPIDWHINIYKVTIPQFPII